MKLRTEIIPEQLMPPVSHRHQLFFIGSCFSNDIGKRFQYYAYHTLLNPFGTVYNPASLKEQLKVIVEKNYSEHHIIQHLENWLYLNGNTEFHASERQVLEKQILGKINSSHQFLSRANYCFITLGTSQVFEWIQSGNIVANCHKLPSDKFERRNLSVNEIVECLTEILQLLQSFNNQLKIVFTISPVRHKKDGYIQNTKNKARLHTALDEVLSNSSSVHYYYFPSYEIVLDEMRDYRFYATDLIHLNDLGIDYIWEKVSQYICSSDAEEIHRKVMKFRKLQKHRVQGGEDQQKIHQQKVDAAQEKLQNQYPFLTKNL